MKDRAWFKYSGYIDPLLLGILKDLNIFPLDELTPEEKKKLQAIQRKYNKGELSENKMKKVSKRKP